MFERAERETPVMDGYLADFGLTRDDLFGKRVLDLGAGSRMFAKDCLVDGVGDVWSVAERATSWEGILRMIELARKRDVSSMEIENWVRVGERSIVADMKRLSFREGSFDLVLSRDAITHVFGDTESMATAFGEVIRVLAKGGEARLFPGWLDNWADDEKRRVVNCLARYGKTKGIDIEMRRIVRRWCGTMNIPGTMIVLHKF